MFVTVLLFMLGCADNDSDSANKDSDSVNVSEDCTPACPEGENTYYASDVPCGSDDGNENTIEASCTVVEECGETIYCRAEGF